MKKSILIPFLCFVFFVSQTKATTNYRTIVNQIEITNPLQDTIKTITLKVTGMTCAGCSISLQKEIKSVEGVIENDVQYPGDIAIIKYDSTKTTIDELVKVIENKGYKAEEVKSKA
jgi:periplasmic mercuric ion binding protein